MSHNTGTVQTVAPSFRIGPASGQPPTSGTTWSQPFTPAPAPTGTKFVILHFTNVSLPAGNRLEVDLGYATDVFDAGSGTQFWTRPINVVDLGGAVPIRYLATGALAGGAEIDRYGRGERLAGTQDPTALSNCDPFVLSGSYTEPKYDPFWFCNTPPKWENIECTPVADIRRQVARSVGMIVTIHGNGVSTCSVTAIGPDTVITAGHCLEHIDDEWPTSSVTFDYQTDCAGNVGPTYQPVFHKVTGYLKFRWNDGSGKDYAILQLQVPPGGLGVPAIPLRPSLPAVGEQIFGIHHPNGATKKLAPPHTVTETVNSAGANGIQVDIDVSGGSSGSGLFDMAGRLVGVLSAGVDCFLSYYPSASILADIAATPTPVPDQDVMLVIDRSGSMSGSAGTGQTKIEEAREAASLFVQLVQSNVGHRVGLASFSTAASIDEPIGNLTPGKKNQLIGPAPYSGGAVGGIAPGGWTSIGAGIDIAQTQLGSGGNPKNILLLTDGLQNTPPMIATAAADLGATTIHAIGLGTESNLDGAVLSNLAQSTGGAYTRAGDGLDLKKFFALAFGDIFASGTLTDPIFHLDRGEASGKPMAFGVCDEDAITVVAGWDSPDGALTLVLTAPDGTSIDSTTAGVESSRGRTWVFLRVPLPVAGNREGTWSVEVRRAGGGGEFPPPPVPLRYFVNVVATGGPLIRVVDGGTHLYTGDRFIPQVALGYPDGQAVHDPTVTLEVTRPDRAAGVLLAEAGLGGPTDIDGDQIPPRQATLMALAAGGGPEIDYLTEGFDLAQDRALTGAFEGGPFARRFDDLLAVPGNYTFRALAQYGHDCRGSREISWTVHVATAIDEDQTDVTVVPVGMLPDGRRQVRVTITPADRFGNLVGPGLGADLVITGVPGSDPTGPLVDNGDGTYSVDVSHDPTGGNPPGVSVTQPGRPSACLSEPGRAGLPAEAAIPWWMWLLVLILLIIIILLIV